VIFHSINKGLPLRLAQICWKKLKKYLLQAIANYHLKNKGQFKFRYSRIRSNSPADFSNGMALGDLDNDGVNRFVINFNNKIKQAFGVWRTIPLEKTTVIT